MAVRKQDLLKLRRIIARAHKLIAKIENGSTTSAGRRTRRTGNELVKFRKMLKAERRKGISVSELARKHKISGSYIYMLP